MKKSHVRLLFVTVIIVAFAFYSQVSAESASAATSQTVRPAAFNNLDNYNIKSTYIEPVGSGYMRVFYNSGRVNIEYYDKNFNITESGSIKMELPVWGGFYKGNNAYYLVEGRNNTNCEDGKEVLRIIKFDTSWNRLGSGSIYAEDVWEYEIRYPFDYSCVNMTESGNDLYLITGREGYVDPAVGQGHQGMMLIRMNVNSFETEIVYGDFGHSFSQYIDSRGTDIYLYEQSEGSRCTLISRFDGTLEVTDYFDAFTDSDRFPVLEYGGQHTSVWSIPCYATVDDMVLSADNALGIGTSIDQSQYDNYDWDKTPYNIYLTVTPLSDFSKDRTRVVWLTSNRNKRVSYKGVSITRVNDNRFLVTWEEENSEGACSDKRDLMSVHKLHYMFIDGSGNPLSKKYVANAAFSDCHPRLCGNNVVFCSSTNSNVNFYSINASTGTFTKKVYRMLGSNATWDFANGVLTVSGSGALSENNDWEAIGDSVKKIVIKGSITKVSSGAFNYLDGLTEVVIENGVKELGMQAFAGNQYLTKITIPASVTKIGKDILWTGWYGLGDTHVTYATIYAPGTSYAAKYAKKNNISFVSTSPKPKTAPTGKTTIRNTIANSAKKTNDVIWDKSNVKGATSYEINWRARGVEKWASRTVGNTVRGTTTGLSIRGLYEIRVRPKNATGAGAWSNTVYRYFHTTEKIRLASKSKGSFTMSWKSNPQATGYQVMFTTNKNGSGAANNINTVGKDATSFTKKGLKSGAVYYVQVRELRKVGNTYYVGNISCPVAVKIK